MDVWAEVGQTNALLYYSISRPECKKHAFYLKNFAQFKGQSIIYFMQGCGADGVGAEMVVGDIADGSEIAVCGGCTGVIGEVV